MGFGLGGGSHPGAAIEEQVMARPVEPCPFIGVACEYVPLAHSAETAASDERARIVQWLRSRDPHDPVVSNALNYYGDAIECGEHWEDKA